MKSIKLLYLIVLLLFIWSCGNKEDNGSISREFFQNSRLEVDNVNDYSFNTPLVDGDQLVFRFAFNLPEEPNIADDELTEVFWFQVPDGQTSFNYQSQESTTSDAIVLAYQRLCFCGPVDYDFISYKIEGTLVSQNQWRIQFSMEAKDRFDTNYTLDDEGTYTLTTN
jgi:hypothetical protein